MTTRHCIYWLCLFVKHIYTLSEKVAVLGCTMLMHIHRFVRELLSAKQQAVGNIFHFFLALQLCYVWVLPWMFGFLLNVIIMFLRSSNYFLRIVASRCIFYTYRTYQLKHFNIVAFNGINQLQFFFSTVYTLCSQTFVDTLPSHPYRPAD